MQGLEQEGYVLLLLLLFVVLIGHFLHEDVLVVVGLDLALELILPTKCNG